LRLHPDLPITALASKEGLLRRTSDPALVMGRRRLERSERSWRFRDPRMEPVARLASRLERKPSLSQDRLFQAVRAGLAGTEEDRGQLASILLEASELAEASPKPIPVQDLFHAALSRWRSGPGPRLDGRRLGLELLSPGEILDRHLPLLRRGLKPALSLEGLGPGADLGGRPLAGHGWCASFSRGGAPAALIAARDRRTLERLLRVEDALARTTRTGAGDILEAGRLYGYPPCCVRAWAKSAWRRSTAGGWAALMNRAASPGPVLPEILPLLAPDLGFVPCSPRCRAAAAAYRSWFCALGGSLAGPALAGRVFVHSLEDPADAASLIPASRTEMSLRYDASRVEGTSGRVAARLRQGDRIEEDAGRVSVLKGTRVLVRWVAQTLVWDRSRIVDPGFWAELAAAALRRSDPSWRRRAAASTRVGLSLVQDSGALKTARG
ncbi:MAG: hypothetical protein WC943_15350, partial [Elusimicrobiota bacterium]